MECVSTFSRKKRKQDGCIRSRHHHRGGSARCSVSVTGSCSSYSEVIDQGLSDSRTVDERGGSEITHV